MSELVVILEDLFPPLPSTPPALPRLAALETWLVRARRERLAHDWRVWLAARIGAAAFTGAAAPTGAAALTPASILAHAWGMSGAAAVAGSRSSERERAFWLATPVHLVAGLDRVLLHPAGLLRLASAEQQHLVEQFAQVFAASPWQLHARAERELLLVGPRLAASGSDPARFLGADPAAGLPQGRQAARLRALGSELELWLHEHPLNREREQRGVLPVTTLWLWGGPSGDPGGDPSGDPAMAQPVAQQRMPQRPTASGSLQLYGDDTCAAALVRSLGGSAMPLPPGLEATAAPEEGHRSVVLYPLQAREPTAARSDAPPMGQAPTLGRLERLERLEQRWLAPALASLRAGRIRRLLLVAADHVYHLERLGSWRLWRTRAPWWEELG